MNGFLERLPADLDRTVLFEASSRGQTVETARGWPRHIIDAPTWLWLTHEVSKGQADMLSLWCDGADVHMALSDRKTGTFGIFSYRCAEARFPSVAHLHPPALRFERAISDLYGVQGYGRPDTRRWLDHGRWGVQEPGAGAAAASDGQAGNAYAFLPAKGEGLHQIAVGPVHAGTIEPGHFRLTVNGEAVVRLEERLGYAHKGVDVLMNGAPLTRAAKLAGRVSGDSTVAYGLAFAQACEAALCVEVPRRALYLRALMAELERLANHIGDIGAICNDASFALMHAHTGVLRERFLRVAHACFGHRLMMDRIVPGGVAVDLSAGGKDAIAILVDQTRRLLPRLIALYGDTTALQDRTVGAGRLGLELAKQYAAGGFIGRASGRDFDARRSHGYAPYDELAFAVGSSTGGDVDARVWVRFDEIKASLALVEQILERLPAGELRNETPVAAREPSEGAALIEGFRGEILAWVRISASGIIERCHLRDPSWLQWPLLEAAIEGNIVADFPLCNKSFNCSYSGHDL